MRKSFLIAGTLLGSLAVIAGAFGAHAIKSVATAQQMNVFETAVRYQWFHVFALIAAGILYREFPKRWVTVSGYCFLTGILLFCGSLYIITWLQVMKIYISPLLGLMTPLGGIFFIAGWISLSAALISPKQAA
jgi:uncharacterized membrane protein YgdD (TMEM256/DUF423 family)